MPQKAAILVLKMTILVQKIAVFAKKSRAFFAVKSSIFNLFSPGFFWEFGNFQGEEAGGEHPVLHRAPGLPKTHRLLPALPLRRRPAREGEEEKRQERAGRSRGRGG